MNTQCLLQNNRDETQSLLWHTPDIPDVYIISQHILSRRSHESKQIIKDKPSMNNCILIKHIEYTIRLSLDEWSHTANEIDHMRVSVWSMEQEYMRNSNKNIWEIISIKYDTDCWYNLRTYIIWWRKGRGGVGGRAIAYGKWYSTLNEHPLIANNHIRIIHVRNGWMNEYVPKWTSRSRVLRFNAHFQSHVVVLENAYHYTL